MYLGHCPPFHPKFSPIQPIRVGDPAGSFLSPFVCHFHTFTFDELVRTLKCLLSSPSKLIYMSAQMFFSNPNPHTWGLPGLGLWAYYNELVQSLSMNPHSALHPLFQLALFYVISSSMQSFMPQIWASVFEEDIHFPYHAHKKRKNQCF